MHFARCAWIALALAASACTPAGSASKKVPPFNTDRAGVALHGYDAVTYFEDAAPREGQPSLEHAWRGARWRFATAENRDRFVADPTRYVPQFGGYCAKAVSENHTADVDPRAYKVVDGKLYLNYSPKVQKLWEEDIPGRIATGERYWPGLAEREPTPASAR